MFRGRYGMMGIIMLALLLIGYKSAAAASEEDGPSTA